MSKINSRDDVKKIEGGQGLLNWLYKNKPDLLDKLLPVTRVVWTKEMCIEDAKKYTNKLDWKNTPRSGYQSATKNKWIEECCVHMTVKLTKWTKEMCKEKALTFNTRNEWYLKSSASYQKAMKEGWFEECCVHMPPSRTKITQWTKEMCIEDAKKYKGKSEWCKSGGGYIAAIRYGWLDECCKHMLPFEYKWTLESCKKEALKYNSKVEWSRGNSSSHTIAHKKGWLDECCKHMEWNKNDIFQEASKYSCRSMFLRGCSSAYKAAIKLGILDDIVKKLWRKQ